MSYQPPYTTHRASDYRQQPFIPFSTRDVADGLGDWFLRKIGVPVANAHPASDHLMNDFDAGLHSLARHWLSSEFSADSLRTAHKSDLAARAGP